MLAGAGILHEEFHLEAFAKSGGTPEMVQLWVNLPHHAGQRHVVAGAYAAQWMLLGPNTGASRL
jgi:redox-sensitive bicupin YhaK (pirin superfamily)